MNLFISRGYLTKIFIEIISIWDHCQTFHLRWVLGTSISLYTTIYTHTGWFLVFKAALFNSKIGHKVELNPLHYWSRSLHPTTLLKEIPALVSSNQFHEIFRTPFLKDTSGGQSLIFGYEHVALTESFQ